MEQRDKETDPEKRNRNAIKRSRRQFRINEVSILKQIV
jgi:hypothetical protein